MSASMMIHGPLSAGSAALTSGGHVYGTIKISDERGLELVIFAPSPKAGSAIANAINAAWAPVVSETEVAK